MNKKSNKLKILSLLLLIPIFIILIFGDKFKITTFYKNLLFLIFILISIKVVCQIILYENGWYELAKYYCSKERHSTKNNWISGSGFVGNNHFIYFFRTGLFKKGNG